MADQDIDWREKAFGFSGNWREYAPIALSNLALIIVTIGFYRFWATARERRYLWSRTRFIDDRLEWTGTGREMFIGFLIVMLVIAGPILFIQFGFNALILRGHYVWAGIGMFLVYLFMLYLGGFARFRALRYRLSRTWWHGIRGGSDDPGWEYGISALWKPVMGVLAFGMLIPWSMVSLWNQRWRLMSFGSETFECDASSTRGSLLARWILMLFSPIVIYILVIVVGVLGALAFAALTGIKAPDVEALAQDKRIIAGGIAVLALFVLAFYFIIAVVGVIYYSAYLREVVGSLRLGNMSFSFTARSKDWIKLFLGDVGLIIGTLGIGIVFLGYRHWSFFIRHLDAIGDMDPSTITQSTTSLQREAEGLADAFDIGAI